MIEWDVDFEAALGKNKDNLLGWLYKECFEEQQLFTLIHALKNSKKLWQHTRSPRNFAQLVARLYLKNHLWDIAGDQHAFKKQIIELFDRNKPTCSERNRIHTIPPIVHQIWLGSPFPPEYTVWQATWQSLGADWEYRLWTDKDIEKLGLENHARYNAATNYGERSDIARYEILYRYGGIYVDTDFECLKPQAFDSLHRTYDFYGALQPLDIRSFALANGVIAATPYHPILATMIDYLKHTPYNSADPVWLKTGPVPFSRVVSQHLCNDATRTIIFPPTTFFPQTMLGLNNTAQDTIAIHHWEASWNKSQANTSK